MGAAVLEDVVVGKQQQPVFGMIDDSRADVNERAGVAVFAKGLPHVLPCAALVFATERAVIADEDGGPVARGSNRIQMQLVTQRVVITLKFS